MLPKGKINWPRGNSKSKGETTFKTDMVCERVMPAHASLGYMLKVVNEDRTFPPSTRQAVL